MRYAIVIENAESNFSAYVPDLPGCIATGATVEARFAKRSSFTSRVYARTVRPSRRPPALSATSRSRRDG